MKTYSFLVLESRLPFILIQIGDRITTKKTDGGILGEALYEVIIPEEKISTMLLFGLFQAGIMCGERMQQEKSSQISKTNSHE